MKKNQAAQKKGKAAPKLNHINCAWVGVWTPTTGQERLMFDRDASLFFLQVADDRQFCEARPVSLAEAFDWWTTRHAQGAGGRLQAHAGESDLFAAVTKALKTLEGKGAK